jgi:hypothetical protein
MHKGLKSTLLTIAVALMGLKAMAMAPVIDAIPDVIIGDAGSATPGNDFSYPDAFDADTKVSDDTTSDAGIHLWYLNSGNHYTINAHTRADSVVIDPANVGATYDLTIGADDAASTDSNLRTLTFRNTFYTPGNPPPGPGIQDGQVITLFASDGTTASAGRQFMAFIDKDGADRLSGGLSFTNVLNQDFTTGLNGWIKNTLFIGTGDGSAVTLTQTANGLCADVSAQGANLAGWASQANFTGSAASAYNTVSLVQNAVYRIRLTVTTTAQAGFTPLWYVMCENSLSWYGKSNYFYDFGTFPVAGLNTPPGTGNGTHPVFETWFQPACGSAPSFVTAAFNTPANAPFKDFRLQLQMLDVGTPGNDPYGGGSDQGAICWKKVEVDRTDASALQVQSTPYNNTSFTIVTGTNPIASGVTANNFTAAGKATLTLDGSNHIVFAPTSTTAWDSQQAGGVNAFMSIYPGDGQNSHNGSADATDNYPVPWTADTLYRIAWTMTAPSALAETNGVDWIIVGGDVDTNEIIVGDFVTTKFSSAAMPKQTPQEYTSFWHGNAGTSAGAGFQRFRPYLFTGTNGDFVDTPNQAGVRVDGIRVDVMASH